MANPILGYPNQVDSTFYTVTLSGGSWQPTMPLANLADPQLAKVARSTDATLAATQFDVDLGVARPIRLFCIPAHTISRAGRLRIRGSETAGDFTAPVYDTGWLDVWTVIYAQGSLPWGHPSFWDGKLSPEDAEDYDVSFIHVAPDEPVARFWRWEIDDTGNADGFVDLARLFMAPGWQPPKGMQYGAELGVETDTHRERSRGGVDYYDRQKSRRTVRFTLANLPEGMALSQVFEMQRRLGIDRQLYFVWDPEDTPNLHRRSFLATMRELLPLEFPYHVTAAYQLEEVL